MLYLTFKMPLNGALKIIKPKYKRERRDNKEGIKK
jgi:hypothetical protein